jgi:hypothetical protein
MMMERSSNAAQQQTANKVKEANVVGVVPFLVGRNNVFVAIEEAIEEAEQFGEKLLLELITVRFEVVE